MHPYEIALRRAMAEDASVRPIFADWLEEQGRAMEAGEIRRTSPIGPARWRWGHRYSGSGGGGDGGGGDGGGSD